MRAEKSAVATILQKASKSFEGDEVTGISVRHTLDELVNSHVGQISGYPVRFLL